ncbi:MAG: methyltransferase domain-containing protein [Ardenticatenaceae bacterium]|nr:methyltransferase domain-containing protein [Ardenticatenaceae bacterium]
MRILTHRLYTQPKVDFVEWVLDKVEWRGNETAVDIGCGSGNYVAAGQTRCQTYIAGDLSFGMVQALSHPNLPRLNMDAQQIPLASSSVDVVLANHMLYHVPDKEAALREVKRVLRPGGWLVAATNSAGNMAELFSLRRQAMQRLNIPINPVLEKSPVADLFSLENGRSILKNYFRHIQRHDLAGALVFPAPQPVLDYIASTRDVLETFLPSVTWDMLYSQLQALLAEHFASHDEFRVNKLGGVFICYP